MTTQAAENQTRLGNRFPEWVRLVVLCLVFSSVAFGYHALFLNTFNHWWFDDDPRNFGFVKTVANPLALFIDPVLAANFSSAPTLNPMLGVSIWLDSTLAYRNILFAQLHNVVILAATLALLFLVLRKWGLSLLTVSTLLLVWLLSPATVAVSGWLAARHHLEGITWSLAAILVAQKLVLNEWRENGRSISLFLFFLGGAALFKETLAITVPLGVGLYLWHRERKVAALSCALLFLVYCGYRCWMVGFTARYGPMLSPSGFVEFISRLPYILFGNAGGYALLALALAPLILMYRRGELKPRIVLFTLVVIASALAVIYPGAFALNRDWLEPYTWIRIVLLLHTGLLVGAGYLISRVRMPALSYIAAAVAILVAAAGGSVTQKKWEILLKRYEAEGKYYLEHPDRLLYSEVPAGWYLDGIQMLYAIPVRHHIIVGEEGGPVAELLAGHRAIWRYSDGKFVEDPELFEQLSAKAGTSPGSP